jgi:hypothetical protein
MHFDLSTTLIEERLRARRNEADRHRAHRAHRALRGAARAGPRLRLGPLRDRAGAALVHLGLRLATPPAAAALRERR